MEYPTEEEACNVTTRSVAREKSRLERKIREEQTQKNDAWLRADAVYMAEFEKLRSQVETLKCELARQQDISKNLARALASQIHADGKTSVHIRFLD